MAHYMKRLTFIVKQAWGSILKLGLMLDTFCCISSRPLSISPKEATVFVATIPLGPLRVRLEFSVQSQFSYSRLTPKPWPLLWFGSTLFLDLSCDQSHKHCSADKADFDETWLIQHYHVVDKKIQKRQWQRSQKCSSNVNSIIAINCCLSWSIVGSL